VYQESEGDPEVQYCVPWQKERVGLASCLIPSKCCVGYISAPINTHLINWFHLFLQAFQKYTIIHGLLLLLHYPVMQTSHQCGTDHLPTERQLYCDDIWNFSMSTISTVPLIWMIYEVCLAATGGLPQIQYYG
jgi:hypothetical protein